MVSTTYPCPPATTNAVRPASSGKLTAEEKRAAPPLPKIPTHGPWPSSKLTHVFVCADASNGTSVALPDAGLVLNSSICTGCRWRANALVPLQARYHHCGEAASDKCCQ